MKNANVNNIAYSSFEENSVGSGWTFTGLPLPDYTAPTGKNVYSLTNGNVTKPSLDILKSYIVSYWSKNGPQNINGTTAVSGRLLNGWTYYEHKIVNPGGGLVTISGTGTIDELRLYPDKALMTTYTYTPLIGITTQCDANNRVSYYEYDALNRLVLIRDQDKNILKKVCYNYAGQPENCLICTNTSPDWQNTTTALRCQQTMPGQQNTGYQEQEKKDMNPCSPTYNQTQWVAAGYNPAACPLPNCNPSTCDNGLDQKCINGVCETGVVAVISSVRRKIDGVFVWVCTYVYCFSDGSQSSSIGTENHSTSCLITCLY